MGRKGEIPAVYLILKRNCNLDYARQIYTEEMHTGAVRKHKKLEHMLCIQDAWDALLAPYSAPEYCQEEFLSMEPGITSVHP